MKKLLCLSSIIFAFISILNFNILAQNKPEKLSEIVNTPKPESYPVASPDGKYLYFTRQDKSQNIWYTEFLENGKLSPAKKLPYPVNDIGSNSLISMPNSNTLIIWGAPLGYMGVKISIRKKESWTEPKTFMQVRKPDNTPGTNIFVGNDLKTIVFSVSGEIKVTFLDKGKWTEPKNLGKIINTNGRESVAFLAADNTTLYFASDGHKGYGGWDLFMSRRLDDTWTNWSKPVNLGTQINTKADELGLYLPVFGEYAYYHIGDSEDKKKNNNGDIYRIKLEEKFRPQPSVIVKGYLTDSKTKEPIQAEIIYRDLTNNIEMGRSFSEPQSGQYEIILPAGRQYEFYAEKEGFYPVSENINLINYKKYSEVKRNLSLAPLEVGLKIKLNNLFFDSNSYTLRQESKSELNRLIDLLKKNVSFNIQINGHTDNVGDASSNKILSKNRAKSVFDFLVKYGIDKSRLAFTGYGAEKPIDSNETTIGKQNNRRVEFEIKNVD